LDWRRRVLFSARDVVWPPGLQEVDMEDRVDLYRLREIKSK
jgi:hypothetical protein